LTVDGRVAASSLFAPGPWDWAGAAEGASVASSDAVASADAAGSSEAAGAADAAAEDAAADGEAAGAWVAEPPHAATSSRTVRALASAFRSMDIISSRMIG
jgi:hypothetical protein